MASTATPFDHAPRYNKHFGLKSTLFGSSKIALQRRGDRLRSRFSNLSSKLGASKSSTSVPHDTPSPCSSNTPQKNTPAATVTAATVPTSPSPPNNNTFSFSFRNKLPKTQGKPVWATVSNAVALSSRFFNSTTAQSDTIETSVSGSACYQSTPQTSVESVQHESVKEAPIQSSVSSLEESQSQAKPNRPTFRIAQLGRVLRSRLVHVKAMDNEVPGFSLGCADDEDESDTSSISSRASSNHDAPFFTSTIFMPDGTVLTGSAATGSEPTNYTPSVFPPVIPIVPSRKKIKMLGRGYSALKCLDSLNCDFPI